MKKLNPIAWLSIALSVLMLAVIVPPAPPVQAAKTAPEPIIDIVPPGHCPAGIKGRIAIHGDPPFVSARAWGWRDGEEVYSGWQEKWCGGNRCTVPFFFAKGPTGVHWRDIDYSIPWSRVSEVYPSTCA